jgi:hypothetical protein
MARKNDLAGLAALGALGMMMSKSKGAANADKNLSGMSDIPVSNAIAVKDVSSAMQVPRDSEPVFDETSGKALSGTRKNLETGELYSTDMTAPSPYLSGKSSSRSSNKKDDAGPAMMSQDEMAAAYKPRYTPSGRAPKLVQGAGNPVFKKGVMPDEFDNSLPGRKKGGAVKKMASGGSSASRRADGIAQKGKTRGKYC